ncbi:Lipin-3 [Desmophyllum pertusum]|uniref:Lipin-3 n=1 Tax=Desmophyllum pertusum TaxID=174260 RepID=A0A9W9Y921_9CNID|nr:Lipin-3 [Desmophyllum pertusum]
MAELGSCPSKSDSIPIPMRRKAEQEDCLSDSETTKELTELYTFNCLIRYILLFSGWIQARHPFQVDPLAESFYPLSDLDSPIGSPPSHGDEQVNDPADPQRYMSDSELELHQSQENIARENEIRWAWGKLPQGPEGFLQDRKPSDLRKEDIKHVHKIKRRDASFKSHHKSVNKEGILLDDLRTVDHEVAALYLHQALDSKLKQQQQQSGSGSEDRESGIGQSLPCSPTAGEGSKEMNEYHDIAMSLCGGLKNGKVPLESFMHSMVTYDELSNNPALLSDPKLVIRINDRYYNWQIAAPMLMSHVIFQRPLRQASLNLKEGANNVEFSVTTKYQGTAMCTATIYLWNYSDKIVISDIDGTITKSDVLGHILPVVGQAWAQSGVAHFFCAIRKNGYKAQQTRDYLKSVKQDQLMLPDGPLLLSPESLIKAFHREVIEKKPEEFKIACLRDIQSLFPTNNDRNPFYAGFGNKVNDVLSYRAVGISVSRIFTINHRGEVRHDLTNAFQTSYIKLSDLVDQMFPPFKTEGLPPSGLIAPDQFSSFTYWRAPLLSIAVDELDDVDDESSEAITSKPQ